MVKELDGKDISSEQLLKKRYIEKIGNIKNSSELFEKFSPWNDNNLEKLIDSFFEAVKKDSDGFSWLDVEKGLPISYEKSIRYGIPNHIKGNVDEASLFFCLVNPNIAAVKTNKEKGIGAYYNRAKKIESLDESLRVLDTEGKVIKDKEYLKNHIVDIKENSSILYNELKIVRKTRSKKDGYYLEHYLPHFIKEYLNKKGTFKGIIENTCDKEWDSLEEMSKKITNLESFPFRSQNPNFVKRSCGETNFTNLLIKSNSKVSLLSARVVIWRIFSYIQKNSFIKPVFIFRRFNTFWLPSITKVLENDLNLTSKETNKIIEYLHEEYFLTVRKQEFDGRTGFFGRNFCRNNKKISDICFEELVKETLGNISNRK